MLYWLLIWSHGRLTCWLLVFIQIILLRRGVCDVWLLLIARDALSFLNGSLGSKLLGWFGVTCLRLLVKFVILLHADLLGYLLRCLGQNGKGWGREWHVVALGLCFGVTVVAGRLIA